MRIIARILILNNENNLPIHMYIENKCSENDKKSPLL